MLKFILFLIFLLIGAVVLAVIRKIFWGEPFPQHDGTTPRSLAEMVEQNRKRETKEYYFGIA